MKRRLGPREGDVFAVQLDEQHYSYGQLFTKGRTADCIVAFDFVTDRITDDVSAIVNKPIVFLFPTVDVEIVSGRWQVIGNIAPPNAIRLPEYKIETSEGYKVLSYKGEVIRDATSDEIERLSYSHSYSPRMLERAMRAKHGLAPWEDWMAEIVYDAQDSPKRFQQLAAEPKEITPQAIVEAAGPRHMLYYLYFPTRAAAYEARGQIRALSYAAEARRSADGEDWVVRVTCHVQPGEEGSDSVDKELENIAGSLGGEYDGREIALQG